MTHARQKDKLELAKQDILLNKLVNESGNCSFSINVNIQQHLLHFEDVDIQNHEYLSRKKYYERLTEILKQSFPHEAKFQNQRFDYYTTMKSKENFIRYTYQLMKGSIDVAVQRAEKLEAVHLTHPPKAIHLHCPCTKVHWLVKELRS